MILGSRLVGRREEIDKFEKLIARLGNGSGGLLLISGHAGIGKTTIAAECHSLAQDRGTLSFWSGFPEQANCPPYWGWISLCRYLGEHTQNTAAKALHDAMSHPRDVGRDAMHMSHLQRLSEIFADVTERSPLVLFFDDIQHADRASARLLEGILPEMHRLPLLIVATFRTGETQSPKAANLIVPRLASMPRAERIVLRGVDELECAELCRELSGWTPDSAVARRLHRQTEGNPLFIKQIVQWLVDHGHIFDGVANLPPRLAVPDGMSEAILVRLDRASAACRRTLELSAILGRRFELKVLAVLDPAFDAELLDEAERLGLIGPTDSARGHWEFSHALIREVIYDRIQPMKRVRGHANAAAALEAVYGKTNCGALAALAYHAFEGQLFYGAERVIDLACRAARQALSLGAYEDAAAQYAIALECFDVPSIRDPTKQIDVALDLAVAERLSGENVASIRTCRNAMQLALSASDWARYAKAALLYEAARWQPGLPSSEVIKCLEIANGHRDEICEADIARIHYSLSRAYQWQDAHKLVEYHALTAIRIAHELQDDVLICEAIEQGGSALHSIPGSLPLRLDLNTEGIEVARRCGDKQRLANLLVNAGVINCEAGNMVVLRDVYAELSEMVRELAQPHLQYITHQFATTIAMLDGEFTKAAGMAATAAEIGRRISGANAAGVFGIQMFLLHRETGSLGNFASLAQQIGREKGERLWRPGYALMLAETSSVRDAAEELRKCVGVGLDSIPRDDLRKITLVFLAEVAWHVKDEQIAHAIFQRLESEAGTAAVSGPAAICFGPVDRSLGKLKAVLKNFDEARGWFDRALKQAEDWKSRPTLLRTACDYCEVLLLERSPSAIKRARELESQFAESAAAIGMASLTRRFAEISADLGKLASSHGFDRLTAREVEVLRALTGGASNADISRRLGISMATTATHVRNILAKTDCKNRTAAAAFAQKAGLVRQQPEA